MSIQDSIEAIQNSLQHAPIGHRIIYHSVVTSTMDVARQEAEQGVEEGTVVLAEEQTVGRGRFGRRWVSTPGLDLSLSIVLYPDKWACSRLSVATCVAVMRAIRDLYGLAPTLKWPNDVLIGGKKVSGILVETIFQDSDVRYAVIGVGINVNFDPTENPDNPFQATSLAAELGRPVQREEFLQAVLTSMGDIYVHLSGWGSVWDEWQAWMETLGQKVQVRWGEQTEEGFAEGVDGEGNLLLRRADGSVVSLAAGEVTLQS